MNEERIIELETKVSYQEDLLQELNKLVTSQQSQLDQLTKTCELLGNRLNDAMQYLPDTNDANEKTASLLNKLVLLITLFKENNYQVAIHPWLVAELNHFLG